MTADPWTRRALELLTHGHNLYSGYPIEPGAVDTPGRLRDQADRLVRAGALPGRRSAKAAAHQLASGLRRTAAVDAELIRLLSAAQTNRAMGRDQTRAVLDDGYADRMPATDTPMGRREAVRRMVTRLQTQRRYIRRSRRYSGRLARGMSRLAYHRSVAPGHVRQRIAVTLEHLGIKDAQARHNWISGYQTLIARESGGRPSVVGSEPATKRGPAGPDSYGLGYPRGLTQMIPATFARYHQPGTSTNIYHPVANICASMNYVMDRYGVDVDGSNLVALVQQADRHRPPKGY